MKPFDYCQLFQNIEADPEALVTLTIGQYYGVSEHLKSCKDCLEIADRVAGAAPDDPLNSINPN